MSKVRSTQPHYIRCLKPNLTLEPGVWDEAYMAKQLAYSGLLEVALVRQAGYAHRRDFDAFYGYYKASPRLNATRNPPLALPHFPLK